MRSIYGGEPTRLSSDRSGRVPFSFAAILILAGSIAAGAYMEQTMEQRTGAGSGAAGPDFGAQLVCVKNDLEAMARRDIAGAVNAQLGGGPVGPCAMGPLNDAFSLLFKNELNAKYRPRILTDLRINATVLAANISAAPGYFRTMNRLGMMVETAGAGALRALCTVGLQLSPRNGPPQNTTLQLDVQLQSWYPFALSQAVRMRRDCAQEGLVELFVREQLKSYLERSIPRMLCATYPSPKTFASDVWKDFNFTPVCDQAVRNAMNMEELVLFGRASPSFLGDYFASHNGGRFAVANALPGYGDEAGDGRWANAPGDGELFLQLPEFPAMQNVSIDINMTNPSTFWLHPESSWSDGPSITVTKRLYAGEELREDVFCVELQVHGSYSIEVHPVHPSQDGIRFTIPVHLDTRIYTHSPKPPYGRFESGRDHCQMENMALFMGELDALYRAQQDLAIRIENATGVALQSMTRALWVEAGMDNEPLGIFSNKDFSGGGIHLGRVPLGPHRFDILLKYSDGGEAEFGSSTVTCNGTSGAIDVRTDSGPGAADFWSTVLTALKDEPPQTRMARLMVLFAGMAGFPVPGDVANTSGNSPADVQRLTSWGQRLLRFLVAGGPGDGPGGQSQDWREMAISTVEVLLEVTSRVEGLLADIEWDSAARMLAISSLNITLRGFGDVKAGSSILQVDFECSFAKSTLSFKKADGKSKRWSLERPVQKDYKWTFDPLSRAEKRTLAFEGALDLAFIVCAASSMWVKYQRYASSDGGLSQYETLDLGLDLAQLCLRIATTVTRTIASGLFQGIGEATGKAIKVAGEAVAFIAGFLQMVQAVNQEVEKFQGDEAAWGSLFAVFDETTITFYLTLATTIVSFVGLLATAGAAWGGGLAALACLAPFLGPAGAILALVTLIVMIIFNAEAIGAWLAGTTTGEARDSTMSSISNTLQDTVANIASLNEYDSDGLMLQARLGRGVACILESVGTFTPDPGQSNLMANLSRFAYDTAWAREHQAVSSRVLRYFLVVLWKQAADFNDADSVVDYRHCDLNHLPDDNTIGQDMDWHVDIKITDPSKGWKNEWLHVPDIEGYLLGLTSTQALNVNVDFILTQTKGTVTSEGLKRWADTIGRIGDMVTVWQNRLVAAQGMAAYLSGMDARHFRNDVGYLQLRLEDAYAGANVTIKSHDGKGFIHYTRTGERHVPGSLQVSINSTTSPAGIYLGPGKYDVEIIAHTPETKTSWTRRTLDVYPYYSPRFCSNGATISPMAKPVFFKIDQRLNRTVELTVECLDSGGNVVGTLCKDMRFNQSTAPVSKFYIDDTWIPGFNFDNSATGQTEQMRESLTYTISITLRVDQNGDEALDYWESFELQTSWIRNDHVRVMQAEQSKHADQLEYSLVIESALLNDIIKGLDGDVTFTHHMSWKMVTKV